MKRTILGNSRNVLKRFAAATLAAVTLVTALPGQAFASKATTSIEDIYISENHYAETMKTVAVPYIDAYKQTGYITGQKNASLYYEKYVKEDAKGSVVISHGNGENLEKYDEMIYYFLNMGYSVYGIEHRGHARSGRLGVDNYQIYVESFDYYYKDLKTFVDQIVIPSSGKENLYLFAHSMGGGIGARFLEVYPDVFDAAILSAPMLEINTGSVPPFFAKLLASGASITPFKNKYVMGDGIFNPDYNFAGCHTKSEVRYTRAWETRIANPALQTGGNSYQWLNESFNATKKATSSSEAKKVKVPVLLFQAGQDTLVEDGGQNTFAKYAKDCYVIRFEHAKHEMWGEKDETLRIYLNRVFSFLDGTLQK
ncbi:MAG: alpha/beta hydrolase [bacterium]|nr:alpha/beta hydrolase [bacterium]